MTMSILQDDNNNEMKKKEEKKVSDQLHHSYVISSTILCRPSERLHQFGRSVWG